MGNCVGRYEKKLHRDPYATNVLVLLVRAAGWAVAFFLFQLFGYLTDWALRAFRTTRAAGARRPTGARARRMQSNSVLPPRSRLQPAAPQPRPEVHADAAASNGDARGGRPSPPSSQVAAQRTLAAVLEGVAAGDQQLAAPAAAGGSGLQDSRSVPLEDADSAQISDPDKWLNDLLEMIWPYLQAAINGEVSRIAGPVMENVPPFVANVMLPGLHKIVAVPIHGISAAIRLLDLLGPNVPNVRVTRVYLSPDGNTCLDWAVRWPLCCAGGISVTPASDAAPVLPDAAAPQQSVVNSNATTQRLATSNDKAADGQDEGFTVSLPDEAEQFYDAQSGRRLSLHEWVAVSPELPPVDPLQGGMLHGQRQRQQQTAACPEGTILASVALNAGLDFSGTAAINLQSLADVLAAGPGGDVAAGRVKLPSSYPANVDMKALADQRWVNQLIGCLWPQIRALATPFVTQVAPKFINAFKPRWIADVRLGTMDLGSAPPRVKSLRIFSDAHDITPDVMLDLDLEWSTVDMLAEVVVQTVGKHMRYLPSVVSRAISGLMTFRGGINDFWINAKLRIMLRPLLERMPVLGAVQVSFVQLPSFGLDLTAYGGEVWMLNPIKDFFFNILRDAVLGQYVFPDCLAVPVDQSVRPINPPEGLLELEVVEARNVPRMDWWPGSHVDMFVEVWVSTSSKYRTPVVSGSRSPVFRSSYAFPVHYVHQQDCKLVCWDQDTMGSEEIGRVSVGLSTLKEGWQDTWVEVPRSSSGSNVGWHEAKKVDSDHSGFILHLKGQWHKFTQAEIGTIVQAQMHGPTRVLRSEAGRCLPESVQLLLLQGTLKVIVERARNLHAPPGKRVHVEVLVCGQREHFTGYPDKHSLAGGGDAEVHFAHYTQFSLNAGEKRMDEKLLLRLHDNHGTELGTLSFLLHEVVDKNVNSWQPLQGGAPNAELMLFSTWQGFFD